MYNPRLKFSNLMIAELTSKHFNYHLQQLVSADLISKVDHGYILTNFGKNYVSKLDETNMQEERQPKVSVALIVTRETKSGRDFLLTRRLKQPYYGKVGGFTGKVRFGEMFEDAARRELLEESGLTGDFQLAHIHHKLAFSPDDPTVYIQDNIFIIFHVTNTQGELVSTNHEQENFWEAETTLFDRDDLFNTYPVIVKYALAVDKSFSEGQIAESGY